jgi:hypothetical protein
LCCIKGSNAHDTFGLHRVKGARGAKCCAQRFDSAAHWFFQLKGGRCRLHPMGPAQEQIVAKDVAQTLHRLSDRGLRQPQFHGDIVRLVMAHQPQEHQQQRQIQPPELRYA